MEGTAPAFPLQTPELTATTAAIYAARLCSIYPPLCLTTLRRDEMIVNIFLLSFSQYFQLGINFFKVSKGHLPNLFVPSSLLGSIEYDDDDELRRKATANEGYEGIGHSIRL